MLHKIYAIIFGLFFSFFLTLSTYAQPNQSQSVNNEFDEEQTIDADLALIPDHPFRIVGFGDSLMAGYLLRQDQSFISVLEAQLQHNGYEITVDNAAVSGDTTTAGLGRVDWSIPDDTGLVILELGSNDMLRAISPELTEKNLEAMIKRLKARKIAILLAGAKAAPNMGAKNVEKFNAIYPTLAKKYNIPLYPFFLDGVAANSQYQLSDGMHPNEQGVKTMVTRFLPFIKTELTKLGIEPNNNNH